MTLDTVFKVLICNFPEVELGFQTCLRNGGVFQRTKDQNLIQTQFSQKLPTFWPVLTL